jgi:hypothetical protein
MPRGVVKEMKLFATTRSSRDNDDASLINAGVWAQVFHLLFVIYLVEPHQLYIHIEYVRGIRHLEHIYHMRHCSPGRHLSSRLVDIEVEIKKSRSDKLWHMWRWVRET